MSFLVGRWRSRGQRSGGGRRTPGDTPGRPWGSFVDSRIGYLEAYRRDYDRIRASKVHAGKPLKIYMSSVTDPYPPQERSTRRTRALLDEMLVRPPDRLVIQSHTPNVLEDLERLQALAQRCRLEINLSVETDMDPMPTGFPRHMYPPHQRIAALAELRAAGLTTVGVVSPLLPLADVETFARDLESACELVILDHFLVGDGSANGLRTRRSRLPQLLSDAGFARWTRLAHCGKSKQFSGASSATMRAYASAAVGSTAQSLHPLPPRRCCFKRAVFPRVIQQ